MVEGGRELLVKAGCGGRGMADESGSQGKDQSWGKGTTSSLSMPQPPQL